MTSDSIIQQVMFFFNDFPNFRTTCVVTKKIKKIKKKPSWNTVFTPTHRQKPTHKSPTAAGMRKHNRSPQPKKKHPKKA
jgi:hypothetical protein